MNRSSWVWLAVVAVGAVAVAWFLMPSRTVSVAPGEQPSMEGPAEVERPIARPQAEPDAASPARLPGAEPVDALENAKRKLTPNDLAARSRPIELAMMRQRPSGPFDATNDGLQTAIDARQPDLSSCFKTARFHDPDLTGAIELSLTLEPSEDGLAVTTVRSGLDDAAILDGCLAAVFQELIFEGRPGTLTRAVTLSAAD